MQGGQPTNHPSINNNGSIKVPVGGNNQGNNTYPPKNINNNPYAKPSPSNFFRCNEPRHQPNECPKIKSVNVVEREKDETCDNEVLCGPKDEDDGDDFEHEVYTCVVRKLMLSQKHEDDTQRHKLFRTRCTRKGMKLELIIDSGSQENIIGPN